MPIADSLDDLDESNFPKSYDTDPEKQEDRILLSKVVQDVLKSLTNRERQVLSLRYGLGIGSAYTYEQIGKVLGIKEESARRIEAKGIRKLKHPIRSEKLVDL